MADEYPPAVGGEAFLFAQSIDSTSYERQRDRLREEMTLAQIDMFASGNQLDGWMRQIESLSPAA